jgi:predicted TIM-barrel fold metal-dependent hydrolase
VRGSIFDADNHFYEPREALTKFLPARYKNLVRYVEIDGRTKIAVNGHISDMIPNPTFEVVARPGAQEDYFRHGNPDRKSYREIMGEPMKAIPAFREPAARLALMDELGIDRAMMYPTLLSLIEERLKGDPEATHAVVHAFNEWAYETWQFNYEDRIFTTPAISLSICERAIEELEWVVGRGAKAILMRPAPVPGFRGSRSMALPEFDPFWAKVEEHGLVVVLHASDSGYARYANEWEGTDGEFLPFTRGAFRMLSTHRPIEDCVGSLICHGVLSRFPGLKIACVENGSGWVYPLIENLQAAYKKRPEDFDEDPMVVLKRNININAFWEDDFGRLVNAIGEDRVLFGSDYPHPEGLAEPGRFAERLSHLPQGRVQKIMGGNLSRLMDGAVAADV